MRKFLFMIFCACCLISKPAQGADDMDLLKTQVRELTEMVKELKVTVQEQQREIARFKEAVPPMPSPQAPQTGNQSRLLQGRWNPDIGVVADTVFKLDSPKADAEGADRLSVRELELVFGSNVDPYSRLDATISFSDFEAASLEEAYLTRFELPLDMTARIGRFKPKIGKAIPIHRDSLETVDEPLVIQRYFGIEGYNKTGADLLKLLELPFPSSHELRFGVLEGGNGDGGTAFGNTRRQPTLYGHLKNFFDVSDLTNFELGTSYLAGSKDEDSYFEVHILGLDATWKHQFNADQAVKFQGELFYMKRHESYTIDADSGQRTDLDGTLFGAYALADFRFHRSWAAGFRLDIVEPVSNPDNDETGLTGYLTFYQSEFARWRAQFSHINSATGKDDNQILLQGTFAIGEHKHKLN